MSTWITGCTFGSANAQGTYIYNGLEFSQDVNYPLANGSIISDNIFYGAAFRHNGINIYRIAENATIDIKNNNFVDLNWDTSNAIRLSNYSKATATVNMDRNSYSEHGTDTPDSRDWAGFFLFQNAGGGSGKNLTINVTNMGYHGRTDQLYVLYQNITEDTIPTVIGDDSVKNLKAVVYGDSNTIAPAFVAETGSKYYKTLAEATLAGDTVTLVNTVTLDAPVIVTKKVTLNLNG